MIECTDVQLLVGRSLFFKYRCVKSLAATLGVQRPNGVNGTQFYLRQAKTNAAFLSLLPRK